MKLRHLSIYETPSRFYIVGADVSKSRYHLLKFDRFQPKILTVGEVQQVYSKKDILELLATISEGNSIVYKSQNKKQSAGVDRRKGLIERVSDAYALLGAVRFLEGYYLLIVTKARVVATLGYHDLFKIEEVALISISSDVSAVSQDEQRYLKLFQSVDLTTNFYFSYTYDLSRTLQENFLSSNTESSKAFLNQNQLAPEPKFVWNRFLLQALLDNAISDQWMVEIMHGYIGQQMIELPCSRLALLLIGRRSSQYAGTRYLKRGANPKGQVANDVETEQIIWDTRSSPHFTRGKFSAFVQRRGSVPLIWSQDPSTRGVVGKPVIAIDINEPHAQTAAAHLRDLKKRYGDPLVVMNLVKRREKRKHEATLHDQLLKAISYLNMFVPKAQRIAYLSFDVARCHKTGNVLSKLEEIGLRVLLKHGWFQSFPILYAHKLGTDSLWNDLELEIRNDSTFLLQHGVSRTNCVDCLDRTNVAQFGIGKVALGIQLYALGVVSDWRLSASSEVCRSYEDLMDEHGDTLALQYAGSQLVHSIKTYKKTSLFQERSRDVFQTLSRYYSNTFGDYDKQNAINIFLGVFRPSEGSCNLWDLNTDHYLHFPPKIMSLVRYCAWFLDPDDSGGTKPFSDKRSVAIDVDSNPDKLSTDTVDQVSSVIDELCYEHYRLWEITKLDDLIREQRDLQKSITVDSINQSVAQGYSFAKLWKQETGDRGGISAKHEKPSLSDDDDEDEPFVKSDAEVHYEFGFSNVNKPRIASSRRKEASKQKDEGLHTGLISIKDAYGFELKDPCAIDMEKYDKCVSLRNEVPYKKQRTTEPKRLANISSFGGFENYYCIKPLSVFTAESVYEMSAVYPVCASEASLKIYRDFVECARHGPRHPSVFDMQMYECYSLERFKSLQTIDQNHSTICA